jgi:uncharacterized membrane protein
MTKHRLELFTDGVFAIVLTLLVLELRPPEGLGLEGLREVAPALLVHAGTFALVGLIWTSHHNILAIIDEIRLSTLVLNLLALFWLTLMPFMAKVAAEHPLDSLGPSGLALCYGLNGASMVAARATMRSRSETTSALSRFTILRLWQFGAVAAVRLLLAALAWVSPWFGYAVLLTAPAGFIFPSKTPEELRRLAAEAAPTETAAE